MTTHVVMVCLGNICRSPMAEAVLRSRAADAGLDVIVESAGTGRWHIGSDADERTLQVLRENGYELAHEAQTVDVAWFGTRDLLVAMDRANLADLRALVRGSNGPNSRRASVRLLRSFDPELAHLPETSSRLDVPDPYYGGIDDFREVLEMVEAATDGMVAELQRGL